MSSQNTRPLTSVHSVSNNTRMTGLNNNDLVIGPSGSGKTGGYVIPNILRAEGSIVVADTKSNLYRMLAPSLRARGYAVYVVDFVHPELSSPYNPLDYIGTKENGELCEQDIMSICRILVPVLDKHEPFWEMAARTVVACLVSFVKEAFPKEEQNLCSVLALFRLLINQYVSQTKNSSELSIPFLEEWSVVRPESFTAKKYQMFKAVMGADRTWSCITQFISTAMDVFDFKEAQRMFSGKPDFVLEELGHHKCAVFLNISDTDRALDKIVNLFYTQALQTLCREADKSPGSRLEVPVRIMLDDFATNAFIPDFDKTISVIRSREISVSVMLQSLTQLETMYEHPSAMTILNNCDHILYLGGNDLETAKYISTYADKPLSKILCMPLDKAVLITRGQQAELADKIRPYTYEIPVVDAEDVPEISDDFQV